MKIVDVLPKFFFVPPKYIFVSLKYFFVLPKYIFDTKRVGGDEFSHGNVFLQSAGTKKHLANPPRGQNREKEQGRSGPGKVERASAALSFDFNVFYLLKIRFKLFKFIPVKRDFHFGRFLIFVKFLLFRPVQLFQPVDYLLICRADILLHIPPSRVD